VPAAARSIKLQVGGEGDSRVEVNVTERGGDVLVAVRTPDSHLAGELRADLPSLATRLEQSGYHAGTLQAAAGERPRLAETPAGGLSQDTQGQSRQNGRGQQQEQREEKQKNAARPSPNPDPSGKEFAWLLSSVR
jgi:hypothetical protein